MKANRFDCSLFDWNYFYSYYFLPLSFIFFFFLHFNSFLFQSSVILSFYYFTYIMILLHFIFPQATHAVVIGELCALSCIYFCGFVLLYKKRNLLHFLTWKDLRALFKLRLRILRNISSSFSFYRKIVLEVSKILK